METRDSAGRGSGFKAFPLPPRAGLRDALCPPDTKVGSAPCPATPKRGGGPLCVRWGLGFGSGL